jgi:hypothetical protein
MKMGHLHSQVWECDRVDGFDLVVELGRAGQHGGAAEQDHTSGFLCHLHRGLAPLRLHALDAVTLVLTNKMSTDNLLTVIMRTVSESPNNLDNSTPL